MMEEKEDETMLKMKMAKTSRINCGGRIGKLLNNNRNKHVANKAAPLRLYCLHYFYAISLKLSVSISIISLHRRKFT